jgi:hypothetical protein
MTASAAHASDPYLTVVLTGRNDNFGGDFTERFLRALRFNHQHLADAGVSHEFVLVEWSPLSDRPFLAAVVEDASPGMVPEFLTSYVVDPEYHEAFSLNPRLVFQEFIAKNVGIRRSRGRFVLTTNTDIFLSRGIIERLAARSLEERTLYRAVRVDLRNGLDVSHLGWDVFEEDGNVEIVNEIRPPCYTNASGDFLLLDRDSSHRLGGFNEVYRAAKIHVDGNFCVKASSAGLKIVDLGSPVYHLGQGTLYAHHPRYRERPELAPWGDIRWNSTVVYENRADWGLAAAPQRPVSAGIHYLDFDWEAVPPMLDLRRILLPAARTSADSSRQSEVTR